MGDPMHLGLDNVHQLLSFNGYSVFSLIDDILARGERQWEDPSIKLLQEGIERDAVDICARLLSHNPASASVSAWALSVAQSTVRSEVEEMPRRERFMTDHPLSPRNNGVVSLGSSSRTAQASTDGPQFFWSAQFKDYRQRATIDILPDNVFLGIFSLCLNDRDLTAYPLERTRKWQSLVHVCQRWRRIIFASPRRLDLHLSCSYGTPIRKNLVFWPVVLPLTLDYPARVHPIYGCNLPPDDEDNIVFALEHASRVHSIEIFSAGSLLREASTVMQKSFPALTLLDLLSNRIDFPTPFPVIPRRFLGGSAPRLQYLGLRYISFPQLPMFLLSARNLLTLELRAMSQNGFISPEAMARGLATLTRLTSLSIAFCKETSPSDQWGNHPDPPMRAIFPALTDFYYIGCSEYLEDFLAQIDTPRLDDLRIEYFTGQIQVPQLSRFIDRTEDLKINQFRRAYVGFWSEEVYFEFECSQGENHQSRLSVKFLDQEWLEMQVSCMAHLLGQLVSMFSEVDHLSADGDYILCSRRVGIAEWLPFFRLFPAVEALHLSGEVVAYITSALEDTADVEEMVTDVFPALYLIWLDEGNLRVRDDGDDYRHKPVGSIERFLSLRQLSSRPVTVVNTEDGFLEADRKPL